MLQPSAMKMVASEPVTPGLWAGLWDAARQRFLSGTIDGRILACELERPGQTSLFGAGHRSYVHLLAARPTAGQILSGGFDRRICWWDAESARLLREVDTGGRPLGWAVSPDESRLAVVGDDRLIRTFDLDSGQPRGAPWSGHAATTAKGNPSAVYTAAYSPDGSRLATGDRNGTIQIRDATTGQVEREIACPRFYSDFNKLPDGTTRVAEYELGGVRGLVYSPDGQTLIAGGMDQYDPNSAGIDGPMGLMGFDPHTGETRFTLTLTTGKGYLSCLAFHSSGWLVAAGGGGAQGTGLGTICLLDLARPAEPVTHRLEMTIRALAMAAEPRRFVVAGMLKTASAGQIEVWDWGTAT